MYLAVCMPHGSLTRSTEDVRGGRSGWWTDRHTHTHMHDGCTYTACRYIYMKPNVHTCIVVDSQCCRWVVYIASTNDRWRHQ